ncbi:MAG: 4-amino-4-deoxychorismate lyase [Verrucomicrobiaceae bacterium]|nr:4-amino-4-deoxychorismate lyase [Verrucomicrobiaceae bacterium]
MDTPISPSNETVWVNGSLLHEGDVQISPFDHGLLTGDGVFETMVAHGKIPFAFTRHYRRLERSAACFGLSIPDAETLHRACRDVAGANGLDSARIRVTVTGGRAPLGSEKGNSTETVIVASGELPHQPEVTQVVTVPYARNEHGALVGLKTTSYGENVVALAYAKENGAREAIFGNVNGDLCEGTGSNIFIVKNGELITPPLTAGCLPGVTRALVVDLCLAANVKLQQIDTPLNGLTEVDSAFLTSTLRGVQPIASVNGEQLKEVGGEALDKIQAAFGELCKNHPDP